MAFFQVAWKPVQSFVVINAQHTKLVQDLAATELQTLNQIKLVKQVLVKRENSAGTSGRRLGYFVLVHYN